MCSGRVEKSGQVVFLTWSGRPGVFSDIGNWFAKEMAASGYEGATFSAITQVGV